MRMAISRSTRSGLIGAAMPPARTVPRNAMTKARAVGQVEADPIATLEPACAECAREPVDRVVELVEEGPRPEEVDRHLVREALGGVTQELVDRLARDVDFVRYPEFVVGQPGTGGHRSLDSSR